MEIDDDDIFVIEEDMAMEIDLCDFTDNFT